jgi:hypothetical protein
MPPTRNEKGGDGGNRLTPKDASSKIQHVKNTAEAALSQAWRPFIHQWPAKQDPT